MAKKDPLDQFEPTEILWKDRKRILGMPISFTAYQVDRDRLTCAMGFFKTTVDELLLYRVLDIKSSRTFGQKLFGVGTITLYSADRTHGAFELKNIKRTDKVRVFLSKLVEYERTSKCLVGKEIYGASGASFAEGPDTYSPPPYLDMDGDGIPD
ncbi:MAG: PH domain-containing protein [Candidatus Pelethousia sp.]|nr:PH domain-containing protein [Candidatus Pelethousia sp.]